MTAKAPRSELWPSRTLTTLVSLPSFLHIAVDSTVPYNNHISLWDPVWMCGSPVFRRCRSRPASGGTVSLWCGLGKSLSVIYHKKNLTNFMSDFQTQIYTKLTDSCPCFSRLIMSYEQFQILQQIIVILLYNDHLYNRNFNFRRNFVGNESFLIKIYYIITKLALSNTDGDSQWRIAFFFTDFLSIKTTEKKTSDKLFIDKNFQLAINWYAQCCKIKAD